MKKFCLLLLTTVTFFSCNWEIPKSVSVKTEAKYEFSLGTFSGDLSQYLSVQTLKESLSGSEFDFQIYDYYPAKTDDSILPMQQFLIDFPIKSISLDMDDYLKNMDFAMELEKMSFEPDIVDLKNFKLASIAPIPVKLGINERIENSANHIKSIITFPKTTGELSKAFLDSTAATITITSPTFTTMTFYEANIEFSVSFQNAENAKGFYTDLTLGLFNAGEKTPLSTLEHINLSGNMRSYTFPLDGKTITPALQIKVISGFTSVDSNANANPVTYNLESALKNVKIKEVKKLTIEEPISVPIGGDTGANITIDIGSSPKCEIGEGSINVIAKKTESQQKWSEDGITIDPKIRLEGGLTATPEEFIKNENEGDGYFIYRTNSLAGKTYKNNEKITVKGEVSAEIKNADIQFAENEDDTIIIEPTCEIKKISKLWLEIVNDDFKPEHNFAETLGEEITKYIAAFGINENGSAYKSLLELNIDYTNTLPAGNSIDLFVTSKYFKVDGKQPLKAGNRNKNAQITSSESLKEKEVNADDELDFKIKWEIPGLGEDPEYPNCVILKNLSLADTYELKITVTPTLNWDYVKIKAGGFQEEGAINTGLNFNSMFKEFGDKLHDKDGTPILDKIELIKMPLYFYCVMPVNLEEEDIGFLRGKINVGTGTINGKTPIWDRDTDGKLSRTHIGGNEDGTYAPLKTEKSLPKLKFENEAKNTDSDDEMKMVIKALEKNEDNFADIANLFNLHSGSDVIFEYGMQLGGGDGEPIKLSKLPLNQGADDADPVKIQFHARLVIPLEIKIGSDEETKEKEDITLSLATLLDKDEGGDLFNRSEETSIDIVDDLIKTLEYAQISAYFPKEKGIIRYFNNESGTNVIATEKNVRVEMNPNIEGVNDGKNYSINIGAKEPISIRGEDFSKILKAYPFSPEIDFVIPKGKFYIQHNFEYELKMELGVKFNGEEIPVFGDKK